MIRSEAKMPKSGQYSEYDDRRLSGHAIPKTYAAPASTPFCQRRKTTSDEPEADGKSDVLPNLYPVSCRVFPFHA